MAEPVDKLAARIEAKRQAAAAAAAAKSGTPEQPISPVPVSAVPAETTTVEAPAVAVPAIQFPTETKQQFPSETRTLSPQVAEAINAIASGANPLAIARLLAAILAGGMKRKELIGDIGKSDSWLSKRLGLLDAPKDMQRLIESGQLSESEYYDNRHNLKAGIVGRGEGVRYNRMPTVSISFDAAKALASILKIIAEQNGAAPIRLDANIGKKDLTNILNLRAGEIKGLMK